MLAQVVLTPAESKWLIAKAVANMDIVKQALERGMVVIHPSSSTYFIVKEITGQKPKPAVWVCGIVAPKGTCVELGLMTHQLTSESKQWEAGSNPEDFLHSWVIKEGELTTGMKLGSLLETMTPRDVYIKGVNALDREGMVGVLIGSTAKGGTIGRVMAASRRKAFSVIFPVGLEKLIPFRIKEAAKQARKANYDYCMGLGCGLLPCEGSTVTELKAIEILSGAVATPIAAGGLAGAEGAIVLVIKGEKKQVCKAIEHIEHVKGAKLPQVRIPKCHACTISHCAFRTSGKNWG